jgi:DNA-binding IclR family transcriptional regulator
MKPRFTNAEVIPAPGARAVIRALTILKSFGGARASWDLTHLAAAVGLHKTTTFRLLGALQREGFVVYDAATATYRLGPALVGLGALARRSNDLHLVAHEVLIELAAFTGETATLEILAGDDVLILDEVHGRFLIGCRPEIGTRWPAHATSTGKVLLASRPSAPVADDAAHSKGRARLARLAPNTITSHKRLQQELATVRRLGYATGVEEIEPGFTAVSAPVLDVDANVVAAVSVGGPSVRLTPQRLPALAVAVMDAGRRVSTRLGFVSPAVQGTHPARGSSRTHARSRA